MEQEGTWKPVKLVLATVGGLSNTGGRWIFEAGLVPSGKCPPHIPLTRMKLQSKETTVENALLEQEGQRLA